MEEPTSVKSPCLGHVGGTECLEIISSDSKFCTHCGEKNPDFLTGNSYCNKMLSYPCYQYVTIYTKCFCIYLIVIAMIIAILALSFNFSNINLKR